MKNSRWQEANLGTELAELDQKIYSLQQERAKIHNYFNQYRARTSVLPPETLSMIFQHACDLPPTADPSDDHRPITLSSVSVHWRQVAHSTPTIWNRLCIHLKNAKYASAKALALMQLYFERLENQSIYLRLNRLYLVIENEGDEHNIPVNTIFHFILSERRTQLCALFIDEFAREWSTLFLQYVNSAGLPNLEWIHIGWNQPTYLDEIWNEDHTPIPVTLIPRLTRLSLAQTSSTFSLPYGQITDLQLEDIGIDRCFETIILCPNIIRCRIIAPHSASDPEKEPPSDPVTLSHTTCFGWAFGIMEWDIALLKYFTFPALQIFRCENQGSDGYEEIVTDEDIRLLQKQFLSRCPSLTVYERVSLETVNWQITDLCDDLPDTIEELYLHDVQSTEAADAFFTLTRGDDWSTGRFLRLRVLELQGDFRADIDAIYSSLITMLESRRRPVPEQYRGQAQIEEMKLRCRPDAPQQLAKEQITRLQELVNDGLTLTMSNKQGKDIIWSPTRL